MPSEYVIDTGHYKRWVTENLPFVARETKGYRALNENDTENREMTREEGLVAEIKQQRVQIDACFRHARRLAERINRGAGGREVALAITHLQEAKMWLGQALGELGTLLPKEYRDFSEDA